MRDDLHDAVLRATADPEVRAIVITGAGKGFCSGGDVKAMNEAKEARAERPVLDKVAPLRDRVLLAMRDAPQPIIAAVNGAAAGAGMNLALACDIRLASTTARFGETFVKRGLHPDWGGTYFLPRIVGMAKAARADLHRRHHRRGGSPAARHRERGASTRRRSCRSRARRASGIDKLMEAIVAAHVVWNKRISTARLNRWLAAAVESTPPPAVAGRRIKIRYMTQLRARPPYFIIFGNQLAALPSSYERFLVNGLRQAFDLPGVPIRISKKTTENPFSGKRERSSGKRSD